MKINIKTKIEIKIKSTNTEKDENIWTILNEFLFYINIV